MTKKMKTKIEPTVRDDSTTDTNQPDEERREEVLSLLREVLENTQANIKKTLQLLDEGKVDTETLVANLRQTRDLSMGLAPADGAQGRMIEGVFNGERMVGPDGQEYLVPPNYASKSKLVEGDLLKLTIAGNGSFIYKQIGPIERTQLVADLARDERTGNWYAVQDEKRWKLLTASVTYFHGTAGDEVVILIPRDGESNWAAVENLIHKA